MTDRPSDRSARRDRQGESRGSASAGQIPAVLYGAGHARQGHRCRPPRLRAASSRTTRRLRRSSSSSSRARRSPSTRSIREVQHSPVKGNVLHVDFLAVRMDQAIHASVPLRLVNDPAGVEGGRRPHRQHPRAQHRGPARRPPRGASRSTSPRSRSATRCTSSDIVRPPGRHAPRPIPRRSCARSRRRAPRSRKSRRSRRAPSPSSSGEEETTEE